MLMALNIITLAMPGHHKDAHGNQGKSYRYTFTTPGSRETIVDALSKGIYALGGLEPGLMMCVQEKYNLKSE